MYDFFKGYVPTKDKKCLMKFKNASPGDLLTLQQVENLPEYAGILAEDTVLIDVDDEDQSEKLMKIVEDNEILCRVYRTTRGKHFLFRNGGMFPGCRNKITLACGITADIKVGVTNSYEILKYDNVKREIIYDVLDGEEYRTAPKYFIPVSTKTNFCGMGEGDGRNEALYRYILTLTGEGMSKQESRDCIRVINKYVFADPLEDDELEVILRDDAFKKESFFRGKNFLFDKFAKFIKSEYNVIRLNGQLHSFDGCVYKPEDKEIEEKMLHHIPDLTRARRSEVVSYLDVITREDVKPAPAKYIAFRNGVLNIETGEMMDFSQDIIITNKINYDYHPDAYDELCDKTLDKMACYDPQIRAILEEAAGYCFYRRNEMRKCFILTGENGQNGKSTYLAMIGEMLGRENISSLDLSELGERFKNSQLAGKLANIGDDIADEFIPNASIFKKLVSGDPISVERKGQDAFDLYNYAKLLFSANNIPRMGKGQDSRAIRSRMIIIPFDAEFTPDDPDYDPYIKYKLCSEKSIEYLVKLGVDGLKRVLEKNGFTKSGKVEKQVKEYEEMNNPVLLFFQEEPKILNEPVGTVYQNYVSFCNTNGFSPISQIKFGKQVKAAYNCESTVKFANGKSYRIFSKI